MTPGYLMAKPGLISNQLLTKQNNGKMKKLLFVLAIASFAVACNNETAETPKGDSSATQTPATAAPDSTAKPADSTAKPADSTAKPVDSTKK